MSTTYINHFGSYLLEQNLSFNTIQSYDYSVKQFYKLFHRLTPGNLRAYKLYLLEHHKPQTVNLRIQALNSYLKYRDSPIAPIAPVRVQHKTFLDRIISQADYEYLIRRLYEDEKYTYYYIVRLITATGVRVSELITFQVEDAAAGEKDIYSKGNKMRRIYIPTRLKNSLLEWTGRENRYSGTLFLNRFGSPLTASGIRIQLKAFAQRYGLNEEVMYPHSFRHRFAKNFIEKSGDIALLSDLLGHDSIETTRIYLTKSCEEQRALIDRIVTW